MDLKKCRKCGKNKPLSEYYLRKTGERRGKYYEICKECFLKRGRIYYHENQPKQLTLAKIRAKKYLREGLKYLAKAKNRKCSDCGKYYPPWEMDFDHRKSTIKVTNVAWLRRFHKLETLKNEIKKCDLVCSNCHRNRTLKKSGKNYYNIIQELKNEGYIFHWMKN